MKEVYSVTRLGKFSPIGLLFEGRGEFFGWNIRPENILYMSTEWGGGGLKVTIFEIFKRGPPPSPKILQAQPANFFPSFWLFY